MKHLSESLIQEPQGKHFEHPFFSNGSVKFIINIDWKANVNHAHQLMTRVVMTERETFGLALQGAACRPSSRDESNGKDVDSSHTFGN